MSATSTPSGTPRTRRYSFEMTTAPTVAALPIGLPTDRGDDNHAVDSASLDDTAVLSETTVVGASPLNPLEFTSRPDADASTKGPLPSTRPPPSPQPAGATVANARASSVPEASHGVPDGNASIPPALAPPSASASIVSAYAGGGDVSVRASSLSNTQTSGKYVRLCSPHRGESKNKYGFRCEFLAEGRGDGQPLPRISHTPEISPATSDPLPLQNHSSNRIPSLMTSTLGTPLLGAGAAQASPVSVSDGRIPTTAHNSIPPPPALHANNAEGSRNTTPRSWEVPPGVDATTGLLVRGGGGGGMGTAGDNHRHDGGDSSMPPSEPLSRMSSSYGTGVVVGPTDRLGGGYALPIGTLVSEPSTGVAASSRGSTPQRRAPPPMPILTHTSSRNPTPQRLGGHHSGGNATNDITTVSNVTSVSAATAADMSTMGSTFGSAAVGHTAGAPAAGYARGTSGLNDRNADAAGTDPAIAKVRPSIDAGGSASAATSGVTPSFQSPSTTSPAKGGRQKSPTSSFLGMSAALAEVTAPPQHASMAFRRGNSSIFGNFDTSHRSGVGLGTNTSLTGRLATTARAGTLPLPRSGGGATSTSMVLLDGTEVNQSGFTAQEEDLLSALKAATSHLASLREEGAANAGEVAYFGNGGGGDSPSGYSPDTAIRRAKQAALAISAVGRPPFELEDAAVHTSPNRHRNQPQNHTRLNSSSDGSRLVVVVPTNTKYQQQQARSPPRAWYHFPTSGATTPSIGEGTPSKPAPAHPQNVHMSLLLNSSVGGRQQGGSSSSTSASPQSIVTAVYTSPNGAGRRGGGGQSESNGTTVNTSRAAANNPLNLSSNVGSRDATPSKRAPQPPGVQPAAEQQAAATTTLPWYVQPPHSTNASTILNESAASSLVVAGGDRHYKQYYGQHRSASEHAHAAAGDGRSAVGGGYTPIAYAAAAAAAAAASSSRPSSQQVSPLRGYQQHHADRLGISGGGVDGGAAAPAGGSGINGAFITTPSRPAPSPHHHYSSNSTNRRDEERVHIIQPDGRDYVPHDEDGKGRSYSQHREYPISSGGSGQAPTPNTTTSHQEAMEAAARAEKAALLEGMRAAREREEAYQAQRQREREAEHARQQHFREVAEERRRRAVEAISRLPSPYQHPTHISMVSTPTPRQHQRIVTERLYAGQPSTGVAVASHGSSYRRGASADRLMGGARSRNASPSSVGAAGTRLSKGTPVTCIDRLSSSPYRDLLSRSPQKAAPPPHVPLHERGRGGTETKGMVTVTHTRLNQRALLATSPTVSQRAAGGSMTVKSAGGRGASVTGGFDREAAFAAGGARRTSSARRATGTPSPPPPPAGRGHSGNTSPADVSLISTNPNTGRPPFKITLWDGRFQNSNLRKRIVVASGYLYLTQLTEKAARVLECAPAPEVLFTPMGHPITRIDELEPDGDYLILPAGCGYRAQTVPLALLKRLVVRRDLAVLSGEHRAGGEPEDGRYGYPTSHGDAFGSQYY